MTAGTICSTSLRLHLNQGCRELNAMRKLLFSLALIGLIAPGVSAQTYPDRPVKLLVPLAAGSAVDIVARLVADKMGDQLGQRPFVENMPGGAGVIGMR